MDLTMCEKPSSCSWAVYERTICRVTPSIFFHEILNGMPSCCVLSCMIIPMEEKNTQLRLSCLLEEKKGRLFIK